MTQNRVNEFGISKIGDCRYVVPINPERVGIVLGTNYTNLKNISNKFSCKLKFKTQEVSPYNYPTVTITSEKELNIWDCINYIQKIVTIPSNKRTDDCLYSTKCNTNCIYTCKRYGVLKKRVLRDRNYLNEFSKRPCYCGDNTQDTFDECVRCLEYHYISKIDRLAYG